MTGRFDGKRAIVFGAAGTIGKAVVNHILSENGGVVAVYKDRKQIEGPASDVPGLENYPANVEAITQLSSLAKFLSDNERKFEYLIYAVGHCPPRDFDNQIRLNLSETGDQALGDEFGRLVIGLFNVYREFVRLLCDGGRILVIGSGINRFPVEKLPLWMNAGAYYIAQGAQQALVDWIRRETRGTGIEIVRLAFGAIDTPFHFGSIPEHTPPKIIELGRVVTEITDALECPIPADRIIIS